MRHHHGITEARGRSGHHARACARQKSRTSIGATSTIARGKINLDKNKTVDPRSWSLDPGVVAALSAWKAYAHAESDPSERVFSKKGLPLNVDRLAEIFRRDLRTAGIARPESFERSASRMPIRVHDLRAGFVTMSLANGKTETWIADRTGHRSSGQIMGYRRRARTWEGLALGTFAELRYAIPELKAMPQAVPTSHLARVAEWQTHRV